MSSLLVDPSLVTVTFFDATSVETMEIPIGGYDKLVVDEMRSGDT